jgi:L-aspartate oxidase
VANTRLHGANRLASNSLLEALVFSDRAYQHSSRHLDKITAFPAVPDWQEDDVFNAEE